MGMKQCYLHPNIRLSTGEQCPKCNKQKKVKADEYNKYNRDPKHKAVYNKKKYQDIRLEVLFRDENRCVNCKTPNRMRIIANGIEKGILAVDHIHELEDGGNVDGKDNLQTLCIDCHNEKTKAMHTIREQLMLKYCKAEVGVLMKDEAFNYKFKRKGY